MLNAVWINGAPLNSAAAPHLVELLSIKASAGATVEAPALHVRKALALAATGSATFDELAVTRIRGLAVDGSAVAESIGEISMEEGGIVHAYLSVNATAGATLDSLPLSCLCPLQIDATAGLYAATADLYMRRRLVADVAAAAFIPQPALRARVNMSTGPTGSDTDEWRIYASGSASARLYMKRRLEAVASALATIEAPRLRNRIYMQVAATAGTAPVASDDEYLPPLYVRRMMAVDATAEAVFESTLLYSRIRLGVDATATAIGNVTIYMNMNNDAPISRTIYVRFNPRTVVVPPPRREYDES